MLVERQFGFLFEVNHWNVGFIHKRARARRMGSLNPFRFYKLDYLGGWIRVGKTTKLLDPGRAGYVHFDQFLCNQIQADEVQTSFG